jgi:hypothetical protein
VSSQSVWLVGYIGVADAVKNGTFTVGTGSTAGTLSSGAGVANGTVLNYNGVPYTGILSVEHGSYTFWVLEHMYYNPNNTTETPAPPAAATVQKNAIDDIADFIYTFYAPTNLNGVTDATGATTNVAGVPYSAMDFTKSKEGAVPTAQ